MAKVPTAPGWRRGGEQQFPDVTRPVGPSALKAPPQQQGKRGPSAVNMVFQNGSPPREMLPSPAVYCASGSEVPSSTTSMAAIQQDVVAEQQRLARPQRVVHPHRTHPVPARRATAATDRR